MVKPSASSEKIKSFRQLKDRLNQESVSLPTHSPPPRMETVDETPDPVLDLQLFKDAMSDVTPLPRVSVAPGRRKGRMPPDVEADPDTETLMRLKDLISHGSGFRVSLTPEYIEGTGDRVHPTVTERLHRGEFSIQEHIDLHGMSVESAKEAFERFLKQSISTGKLALLIVHGRGLSSPAEPILKTKVYEWLTRGAWRKWVVAFSSARSFDGGAGATYVLLRQRPLSKRHRKKKKEI